MNTLSEISTERLLGVEQKLIEVLNEAIKESPIAFEVKEFGGVRTHSEQKELYKLGLSKEDGIRSISKFQFGKAFGICVNKEVEGVIVEDYSYKSIYTAVLHILNIAATKFNLELCYSGKGEFYIDK